jgi:hypothetical protein
MTCPQCGAAIKKGDGKFCSHCGTVLPTAPAISSDEWRTHPDRFDQAERDAQHDIAMELEAPKASMVTDVVVPTVFLVFWIAIGIVITSGFANGPGKAMALFPLAMMIAGVVFVGAHIRRSVRKANAPVLRTLAVLVDKRTEVSSHRHRHHDGRRHQHTTTSYYATLELRDGSRLELPTTDGIAGYSSTGDIGLAVMRGGDLIDFHRYRL